MRVVIVGNGIAGITLARHLRKRSDVAITVVSAEQPFFFSRTALMYVFMGQLQPKHLKPYEDGFWKKNRIELVQALVKGVDTEQQQLKLSGGKTLDYQQLVLATGSVPRMPGIAGEQLEGVQGFYHWQDLEKLENYAKKIKNGWVVGGGLIGIELAEMLHTRQLPVQMLIREPHYWASVLSQKEALLIETEIAAHHIALHKNEELAQINGTTDVKSFTTKGGSEYIADWLGLGIGVTPNVSVLEGSAIDTERGILVDRYFATNVPNVYAIGDCAQFKLAAKDRKALEQVWYTGRMHGETLALTLSGNKTAYAPGPWFNSAKFFRLEYQTYGLVPNEPQPGQAELYWQGQERALRVVYNKESGRFTGINAIGIRLRHHLFDKWLRAGAGVEEVIQNLRKANFDQEFSRNATKEITGTFAAQAPQLQLRKSNIFSFSRS